MSNINGGSHHPAAQGGGTFSGGVQAGMTDLANMGIGFPWSGSTRGRPRRGMMKRAVFSDSQRRGLEKKFTREKYISKPDRKKLAEKLGLKDSQVRKPLNHIHLVIKHSVKTCH